MVLLEKQKPKSTIGFLSETFIESLEEDKYLIEKSFGDMDRCEESDESKD